MNSEHLDIDRPIEREPGEKIVENIIGWIAFAAFSPIVMVYAAIAAMMDARRLKKLNAVSGRADLGGEGKGENATSEMKKSDSRDDERTRYQQVLRGHLIMLGISAACTSAMVLGVWLWLG